ncbi:MULTISPECIES: nucleoside deaminase [unclassified Sphingomonas]|uniref:nucleoside deaminase n=1 Tax=unclassified Sphingomonas TaxID=196159 RepID=UPI00092A162A|nr:MULTISPECIES: nucleoside deaminase [unclassified Sphingomonas]MBN8847906.1 nucleoside deaminase [Sphingomonas sp.]OJV34246.1 MAG: tRNA-specific adenosine deaminase [Sphingomonas sp. 67-36]
MTAADDEHFLRAAIDLARENVARGGRPFGALVVRNGAVIATGVNEIIATHDPTAHAELGAIRAASRKLGSPDLSGCVVYASGQPCPMCMAAMRMAGIATVAFACSNADGEPFGLSTEAVRRELALPFAEQSMAIRHIPVAGAPGIYAEWRGRQQHPA